MVVLTSPAFREWNVRTLLLLELALGVESVQRGMMVMEASALVND